jgi:ABC-2 type transport system ATP-binding protein
MLTISGITKHFGRIKALEDVSFSVKEGEIVGLLGPNGAGKTTTMRIISGFLSPDEGDVTIGTYSVLENPTEIQKLLGYLPENNPLYKDMLVSEFLDFSAALHGLEGKNLRSALNFAVSAVSIKEVYSRPIRELSKGFKQRVGLAAALLHKPKVLILDEPTEGLDPNQRVEIRKLIKKLSENHTIIISTHVMQEAEALCSRVVVLNEGGVIADSTVRKLTSGLDKDRVIVLDVEGPKVRTELKSLKARKVEITSTKGSRFEVRLTSESAEPLQPEISKLAQKNKWTIWGLREDALQLEEVFKKLTGRKKEDD